MSVGEVHQENVTRKVVLKLKMYTAPFFLKQTQFLGNAEQET